MSKKRNADEMSFLEHLEELRWHIVRALMSVLVFSTIAFASYKFIFDTILFAPRMSNFFTNRMLCHLAKVTGFDTCINNTPFQLISINMSGQFSMHISVSIAAGLIFGFPYIFWELWRFIKPALYTKEQKYVNGAVFFISILFFIGVLFGYYIVCPMSIHFLGSYSVSGQVLNQINLESYIDTTISILLASGAVFELPILIYFLSKVGIVSSDFLRKFRRHALVVILVIAAIITPPDVFSQIMVSLPLVALYEVGIIIAKRIEKNKKKAEIVLS